MVKAPVELIDGTHGGIVTIYEIRRDRGPDRLFTTIANMFDPIHTGTLLGNLLFPVIEPFQGLERLVDVSTPPSTG